MKNEYKRQGGVASGVGRVACDTRAISVRRFSAWLDYGFSWRWCWHDDMGRADGSREIGGCCCGFGIGGVAIVGVKKQETKVCADCGAELPNQKYTYCFVCGMKRKRATANAYNRSHAAEISAENKARYDWLKSRGYCVVCGHEKASEYSVRCPACAAKAREQQRRFKARKQTKKA